MKWLKVVLAAERWDIHLVRPKSKYLDYGLYEARCFFDKRRIYIAWEPGEQESTVIGRLLHELRHALNHLNGSFDVLQNALGKKEAFRVDEALVSIETPHWHRLLVDMGCVFPKLPSR